MRSIHTDIEYSVEVITLLCNKLNYDKHRRHILSFVKYIYSPIYRKCVVTSTMPKLNLPSTSNNNIDEITVIVRWYFD